jgi:hypothetical protein
MIGGADGIEGVHQGLLDEEAARDEAGDGGALAEDDEDRGDDGERAVDEGEHDGLRDVGEGEHEGRHGDGRGEGWRGALHERLPELLVADEVVYPLGALEGQLMMRRHALIGYR